jgi:putative ABC transport system permease protein
MFKNNLKFTLRNLLRFRVYSIINILGLSVGMACVILIYLWVQDELSFDRFHKDIEDIYRIVQTQYYTGDEKLEVEVTQLGMAKYAKENIPGVVHSTRYTNWTMDFLIQYDDRSFVEKIHLVDPEFLEIFSFPLIKGDKKNVLKEPYSIVLTSEMSEKIFRKEDPIGKIVTINNQYAFTVTGIIKKPPKNSHLWFNFLIPATFFKELGRDLDDMGNNFLYTYVQMNKGADIEEAGEKLTKLLCEKQEDRDRKCTRYYLQPLKRIHLYPVWGGGPIKNVKIFSLIAFLILVIACINFINLSTALATGRFKEIGLKKVVGGNRKRLIIQYYIEVFLLVFISLFIAFTLTETLLPVFNKLTGKEITIHLFNPKFIVGIISVTLVTVFLAGTYPALYISSPSAVNVIKGDIYFGKKKAMFREILVIVQFSIAIILIINTIIINKQLVYMQNRELGINKENIISIPLRGDLKNKYETFKNELLKNKNILSVTFADWKPTGIYSNSGGWDWTGKSPDLDPLVSHSSVGYDYAETFGLKINKGDFFPRRNYNDTSSIVINKTFADIIGIEPLIGEILTVWVYKVKVVGIVEDYNFKPAFIKVEPIALFIRPDEYKFVFVKVISEDINKTIKFIENTHSEFNSAYPFEYSFLDDDYNSLYWGEKQRRKIFSYFAFFSIFISCLGLFGLSSFIINRSTKDIGIRKVNGANVVSILSLYVNSFSKWIAIAIIISFPVAYYTMHKWLQNYAYKTEMSWWVFALAGIIAYAIAMLTVSLQSWRAASRNPVEALRYE